MLVVHGQWQPRVGKTKGRGRYQQRALKHENPCSDAFQRSAHPTISVNATDVGRRKYEVLSGQCEYDAIPVFGLAIRGYFYRSRFFQFEPGGGRSGCGRHHTCRVGHHRLSTSRKIQQKTRSFKNDEIGEARQAGFRVGAPAAPSRRLTDPTVRVGPTMHHRSVSTNGPRRKDRREPRVRLRSDRP